MAEEKKEVKGYKLIAIPTGQALAIQTPDGEQLSSEEAIVEILNVLNELKLKF